MDKLDKTFFKKQSHEEANNNVAYWLSKPLKERWIAAYRLSLRAYGLDPDVHPRLDKTYIVKRKRED